jgi:Protein of unknown function (DUF2934)
MTQASPRNVTQMSKNQRGPSDHEGMNMQEEIRQRAYELYEERGRHDGHQLEDWIQAEQELRDKFGLGKAA